MAKGRVRIAVGDLFEKTNATRWLWQVRELVTPAGHRPHARLVRYDYPSESRLFALSALADTRLFLPAARASEATGPTPQRNRLASAPSATLHGRILRETHDKFMISQGKTWIVLARIKT